MQHAYTILFRYGDDKQTLKIWAIGHVHYED